MLAVLHFSLDRTMAIVCGIGSEQSASQSFSGYRMLAWESHARRSIWLQGVPACPTVPGSLRRTCLSAAPADRSSTMSRSK